MQEQVGRDETNSVASYSSILPRLRGRSHFFPKESDEQPLAERPKKGERVGSGKWRRFIGHATACGSRI